MSEATYTVKDFFAPDGLIARVKPDFTPRAGQSEFSDLIMQAIADKTDVIAEAPTGFGKSFSVLVPAILAALEGKRVVISTETLTLQDQYILKDLPLLQMACAAAKIEFSYAVAKGRTNYVCRTKLDEDEFAGTPRMMEWAKAQQIKVNTGDMASVPFEFDIAEWKQVCADEDCERSACPFYGGGRKGFSDCFVYAAACRFLASQIIVANHTLVLLDVASEAGSILGHYDVLIVDEAHVFASKAQDTWGTTLKPRTVSSTIKLINRMLDKVGINHFTKGYLGRYREIEDRIFAPFQPVLGQSIALKQIPPAIVEESKEHSQVMVGELRRLSKELSDYIVKEEAHPQTVVIRACKEKLSKLVSGLNGVYGDNLDEAYKDNWLVFLETGYSSRREQHGILNLKPINVAPLMKSLVYDTIPTTVFMSATMRIGPSFGFMRRELGIPDGVLEFVGASPFNFEDNVTGYFPTHLPDNRESSYLKCLAEEIGQVLIHSRGRALVLFTNNSHMRYCHEYVSTRVPHRCFLQGQASKAVLIEMFKADVESCLFATRSFFTGVDIPGEALSCVVLTKAPFQVPTDPMFKAKCDLIDDAGGDSFNMLSMPTMLFDVRQSFGRLIRTTTDTGLFAFLDSRATNKSYGRRIVGALPGIRITDSLDSRGQKARIDKSYTPKGRTEADMPSPEVSRKTASLEED
jgi:ATP-dependent DNA helicase DinG